MQEYMINAQYTIYMILLQAKVTVRIKFTQIKWFLGQSDRRLPKADSKTKLAQGGPSGSSPLKSDNSCDGQAGGWIS
jgi:hypothetical protein